MKNRLFQDKSFDGGGEMGALIRAFNWSSTALGPIEEWPQSLKTTVSIVLNSSFPMFLFWGEEKICLYNDAYRPSLGQQKHPKALGQTGAKCWAAIWHIIEPQIKSIMAGETGPLQQNQPVPFDRDGYFEEIYFTYSYSAVRQESGEVGGVLVACTETTELVIDERRLHALRELSIYDTEAQSPREAVRSICQKLPDSDHDVPFALFYELDRRAEYAVLIGAAGLSEEAEASPNWIDLRDGAPASPWPLKEAATSGMKQVVEDLDQRFEHLPGGAWPEAARQAIVLPLSLEEDSGGSRPRIILVIGISPRKALDARYLTFCDLLGSQVASVIAKACSHQEFQQRAEALIELDRVKTEFFNNVSHEFRTPLALIIGPLEEEMREPGRGVRLEMIHRNSLRLLKLVNSLMSYSRMEAGRIDAIYQPTDLARHTMELASTFRSSAESAGLKFIVECPPLPQPVHVDREMWQNVVLNLLSNALKFTFAGEIKLTITWRGAVVNLSVSDTGCGIPESEIPRIFERFHRVLGSRSRTHEGTGIGLALVQKIAQLHGGDVTVQSQEGHGSTFTVAIRTGSAHLPKGFIQAGKTVDSRRSLPMDFAQEASHWLWETDAALPECPPNDGHPPEEKNSPISSLLPRILIADDNADMRAYLSRLLQAEYVVEAVCDGEAAWQAARARRPDLVLTDVMMPVLDGVALLQKLRSDPATCLVPVVMLSARANEESRVEGLTALANAYLIKPFSARELLACVAAHLELARVRRERTAELSSAVTALEAEIALRHRLERKILEISETEQCRIGQDLHDGLGQVLAGISLLAKSLDNQLRNENHPLAKTAAEIALNTAESISSTRSLAKGLYPVELERFGLNLALEDLAIQTSQRFHIDCRFLKAGTGKRLKKPVEIHLYRIVQESITNAIRHGQARHIVIESRRHGRMHTLSVTDDGIGSQDPGIEGMGLPLMGYRAKVIGAQLQTGNTGTGGFRVFCQIPL